MMFGTVIIGILSLFVPLLAIQLSVPSDGSEMVLLPKNGEAGVEYRWDLTACAGCKMVLDCTNMVGSCYSAKIIIDNGEVVKKLCSSDTPYILINSLRNKMSVVIKIGKPIDDVREVHCIVKSTPPYLNVKETEIDSTEHGLITKEAPKKPSCKCGWTNKNHGRIVNGKETGINEYPFAVLIMFADTKFPFCGGSIITPYHVLTAAHCTYPYADVPLSVAVGEHDIRTTKETSATKIHDVVKIYENRQYDPDLTKNDIAILEVAPIIKFTDKVGPVCLPNAQRELLDSFIKVMGWGLTEDEGLASPVLMKVNLRVINSQVCNVIYETIDSVKQICTYNNNKDSCQGDSGGPLVRVNPETNMYEQVGVVSFGMKCGSTDPAVNTNVPTYNSWIKRQIKASNKKVELCYG